MTIPRYGKVITDHLSSASEPLVLAKGDIVRIGREFKEDPEWRDWIACTDQNGSTGWVPKQYLDISGNQGTALHDYSAAELNVTSGDVVIIHRMANGWAWSEKTTGERGWIPIRNIRTRCDIRGRETAPTIL
jgi:Variant SH3 domain